MLCNKNFEHEILSHFLNVECYKDFEHKCLQKVLKQNNTRTSSSKIKISIKLKISKISKMGKSPKTLN